jgi:hypothetical protein
MEGRVTLVLVIWILDPFRIVPEDAFHEQQVVENDGAPEAR